MSLAFLLFFSISIVIYMSLSLPSSNNQISPNNYLKNYCYSLTHRYYNRHEYPMKLTYAYFIFAWINHCVMLPYKCVSLRSSFFFYVNPITYMSFPLDKFQTKMPPSNYCLNTLTYRQYYQRNLLIKFEQYTPY